MGKTFRLLNFAELKKLIVVLPLAVLLYLVYFIFLIAGFYFIYSDIHAKALPEAQSLLERLHIVFSAKPVSISLYLGLGLTFFFLIPKLLFNIALSLALNVLNKGEARQKLSTLLENVFQSAKEKSPDLITNGVAFSKLKLQWLQTLETQSDSFFIRFFVRTVLAKIQLGDVDFQQSEVSLSQVLQSKILKALDEQSNTSYLWIVATLAILLIGLFTLSVLVQ